MPVSLWTLFYGLSTLFWLWILRWGGAERLEGTFASGFFLCALAPRWNAEEIKLFALLSLVASTILFVIGLFVPAFRSWWLLGG